jgi:hypothetical protein
MKLGPEKVHIRPLLSHDDLEILGMSELMRYVGEV